MTLQEPMIDYWKVNKLSWKDKLTNWKIKWSIRTKGLFWSSAYLNALAECYAELIIRTSPGWLSKLPTDIKIRDFISVSHINTLAELSAALIHLGAGDVNHITRLIQHPGPFQLVNRLSVADRLYLESKYSHVIKSIELVGADSETGAQGRVIHVVTYRITPR